MNKEILDHRRIVLNDTVEYFRKYPRCVVPVKEFYNISFKKIRDIGKRPFYSGSYAGINSTGCAIGRLLPDTLSAHIDAEYGEVGLSRIWHLLPEHVQELGEEFLTELSCLHDNDKWWFKSDLSQEGKEFYQEILNKFC